MVPVDKITKYANSTNPQLSFLKKCVWGRSLGASIDGSGYQYSELILSIAKDQKKPFLKNLHQFEARKITENTTWCYDNTLVFFILYGLKKFQIESNLVKKILSVRNQTEENRGITQTFNDINQDSYSIELPWDFVKVVMGHLLDGRKLDRESAKKCYAFITSEEFFDSLDSFFQLVAARSYELILFERVPKQYEDFEDLMVAIAEYKKKLNLRQWVAILWALPYKWVIALVLGFVGLLPQIVQLLKAMAVLLEMFF